MKPSNHVAVSSPAVRGRRQRFYVARERIGGGFGIVAECSNEADTDRIAKALNQLALIEAPRIEVEVQEAGKRRRSLWPV